MVCHIYRAGQTVRKIIHEIVKDIEIKGIVVLDKETENLCDYPVYDFRDSIELAESHILVTPVCDIDYIKYSLDKGFGIHIVINMERNSWELTWKGC